MDISAKNFKIGESYKVDDIVKIDNLSIPDYIDINDESSIENILINLADDQNNLLATDDDNNLILDVDYKYNTSDEVLLGGNAETRYGFLFKVDNTIGYSAQAMIKKSEEESELKDPYTTYLFSKDGEIDKDNSIGLGVGVQFFDKALNLLTVKDERKTKRALASSELNHIEWYNAQLDIRGEDIPQDAKYGLVFVFLYGHKQGFFQFQNIKASPLSKFFYCTKDHVSSLDKVPPVSEFWTQEFHWRPSYNSRASFSAINEYIKLGDGADYITNSSINSLPLEINLSFNNRTDKQARAMVHFLQEKFFPYDSIFSIDYKGDKLLSEEVGYFNFKYTYPYKKDLKFTCTNFSHNISSRNNNSISATFNCTTESVLNSFESSESFNYRTDALIPLFIDKETEFKKGEKITLNTFSLEEPEIGEILSIEGSDINNGIPSSAIIKFNLEQDLDTQDCVYIETLNESIYNVGKTKVVEVISPTEIKVSPILEEGSSDTIDYDNELKNISIKKLQRCPEDCVNSRPLFPEGVESISAESQDPITGELRKRVVFLKNYRRLIIESDISASTSSITFTPLENFKLQATEDFKVIIPAVMGKSSIYFEDPDAISKYPWLEIRNFEHKPSFAFSVNQAPEHVSTNFLNSYERKFKRVSIKIYFH